MGFPKKSTSDANYSLFQFLPPEIIIEILTRLPVKALGRFSTVSKSWHSLIKSKNFIDEHIKNCCFNHVLSVPTVLQVNKPRSYSLYSDTTFVQEGNFGVPPVYDWLPTVPIDPNFLELLPISNSSHGILCFTRMNCFYGRMVFLYNPILKKLKRVSDSCFPVKIYGEGRVYSRLGFGLFEPTSDFKIVRIHYIKDENSRMLGNVAPEVEIYSQNANDWRRISSVKVESEVDYRSVYCNGWIYWLAKRKKKNTSDPPIVDSILCFDISSEMFSEIELPVDCKLSNSFREGSLLVFKGSLALFKENQNRRVRGFKCYELWVMSSTSEYKGAEFCRTRSDILSMKSVEKAFGFTQTGKLLMQLDAPAGGNILGTWDPKGNGVVFEHPNVKTWYRHIDPAFVESFML